MKSFKVFAAGLFIIIVFFVNNNVFNKSEIYFLSSDISRSALVAKNIYANGEYATQTIPLLALDKYKQIPLTDSGHWVNADRFPLLPLVMAGVKCIFPTLSFMQISYLVSTLCLLMLLTLLYTAARNMFGEFFGFVCLLVSCFFPNMLVQIYSKGGDDILLFFTFSVFLITSYQNKKVNWCKFILLAILLFFARSYLTILVMLVSLIVIVKPQKDKLRFIFFSFLSFVILLPYFIYNIYIFDDILFSVNAYVQLFFDIPASNFSNTWWLFKLNESENISKISLVLQIFEKSFFFILNNTWFLLLNWTIAVYSLYLLFKHRHRIEEINYMLVKYSVTSIIVSSLVLSPLAFSGPTIDYFIYIIPMLILVVTGALRLYCLNNLNRYEKMIFKLVFAFYFFRKLWAWAYFEMPMVNLLFSLFGALVVAIMFLQIMEYVFKKRQLVGLNVLMFMLGTLFVSRQVQDWEKFADAFSVKGINSKSILQEIENAELIFSLNGFWGIAYFTNSKVLALPENIMQIKKILSITGVPIEKSLILISNPPKHVSNFSIPLSSQVYVEKYRKLERIGDYTVVYKDRNNIIWKYVN